jgi:uncharacterized RDD family membrane protein YckC
MTDPPLQPPGWYVAQGDPPGTHRWWDGAQWIGGPVAAGFSGSASTPPPPYSYPPPGYAPPGYGEGQYGSPQYGSPPYGMWLPREYAGWWRRVGASLIDSLVVGALIVGLVVIGVLAVPTRTSTCTDVDGFRSPCDVPTGTGVLFIILLVGLGLALVVGYHTYFVGKTGQTIGRKACGIAVVDEHRLQPIGIGRALGRYAMTAVIGGVCAIAGIVDVLFPLWDDKKQTLHDKVVSSVVVRR